MSYELQERAYAVLNGSVVPEHVTVDDDADFYRINDDVADLAPGAVETSDRSALTGDDDPPPIDRSRRFGIRGGLRPPLALHQTDLERQMPRNPDGSVVRTADPRYGGWFRLANDGGPQADASRGINCLDCTLSLYDTWVHGRPRVSAPRTFDAYLEGDVRRPVGGEVDGPRRVEEITGGRFQKLCPETGAATGFGAGQAVERGYRDLHEQLLLGGHGSYAFLVTSLEHGGSHAWVALNQNGTVLYLDPQSGHVWDRPLYTHSGVPGQANVVGIDALVLGRDGRPMPLAGRPPGDFNVLPDVPEPSDPPRPPAPRHPLDDVPDFNHVHLLGEPTSITPPGATSFPGSRPEPDPNGLRRAHLDAHAERIAAGQFVRDAVAAGGSLDEVFAAGVTPVELANHVDASTLRRLVPDLDEAAARDVAQLLGDPRVRQMLDQTWEAPPSGKALLAETLVRQLTRRPDLARMMLATPELAASLTARPVTMHHLAGSQNAIDVLGAALADVAQRGPVKAARDGGPEVEPTPLTEEQRRISASCQAPGPDPVQPGFDYKRRGDSSYRHLYLDQLYVEASLAQPEVTELARRLASRSARGAVAEPRPGQKDRRRAEDKVNKYRGDVSLLTDLAAASVAFERLSDLYGALETIRREPGIEIVYFEDRFLTPQESGYRDVMMMLRTTSGHIAEFRLHLQALEEVAAWEHALYEVGRDLKALADQEGRSMTPTECAVRNGLLQQVRRYFWEALQTALVGESHA
ncbi:toxin glutamine deamidase domain-containing protein [Micromonospora sicca]|nr:toxin glutamine deamidase domain-containing protein [Micromonospora sp. 4G51]